ncbi:MAG TPA: hypothetical protein VJH94_00125 [Candidatus Paceibacterota bacterium]
MKLKTSFRKGGNASALPLLNEIEAMIPPVWLNVLTDIEITVVPSHSMPKPSRAVWGIGARNLEQKN